MDYLFTLANALGRDPAVRSGLTYRPNSSLYHAAGRLRYIASRARRRATGTMSSESGTATGAARVLEAAESGATLPDLVRVLLEVDPQATPQEANEFLAELVDQQVLVDDLDPPITGPEALDCALRPPGAGHGHAAGSRCGGRAARVGARALARFDGEGLGVEPARYEAVAEELRTLPSPVELARLFQVDLVKPERAATLGEPVLAELVRGVDLLHRLGRRRDGGPLERFRQRFLERYEGRDVALTEALDDEIGVGYHHRSRPGTVLLDGLGMPEETRPPESLGDPERHLLRLVAAAAEGRRAIELSEADLDRLARPDAQPLPDAFALMAAVAGVPAGAAVDAGALRVLLLGLSGPSGAILLGRFCHADPALHAAVEDHLSPRRPHTPTQSSPRSCTCPSTSGWATSSARPVLRAFEIAFHGRSGAAARDRQIPLADLRVSVDGGEVRLWSVRLGKRVLPRLTSCIITRCRGTTSTASFAISRPRGPPHPRVGTGVRCAGCRLSLGSRAAGWCWRGHAGRPIPRSSASWPDRPARSPVPAGAGVAPLRGLPRWIELAEGDQLLPIDLDNPLLVDTLVELVKGARRSGSRGDVPEP